MGQGTEGSARPIELPDPGGHLAATAKDCCGLFPGGGSSVVEAVEASYAVPDIVLAQELRVKACPLPRFPNVVVELPEVVGICRREFYRIVHAQDPLEN